MPTDAPHPDPTLSVTPDRATRSTADPGVTNSVGDPAAVIGGPADGTVATTPTVSATRYELEVEIARGGMGVVYRATDTAFDREVAVKVLLDKYAPTSGIARRFADEARISGQLQHPNIPAVHDLGTLPDGRPFLAMKLIKGETLEDLLKARTGPADDRGRFLAVFEQVCQAVAYAHAHKIIHRDLKPGNVMVGAFGEVQVMDWGLAKELGTRDAEVNDPDATAAPTAVESLRQTDSAFTQAGTVLGTPAYMPPEQAVGAIHKVDARSDVFGLGAILAVILTRKPPFVGKSAETTRLQAAQGDVEECYARLDASGAEPELVVLCKRCLSKKAEDRPANAGEVAKAVAALRAAADERARQAELDAVQLEGERQKAEVQAAEQRKRRRVQLALAGVVVGLFATAAFGVTIASMWRDAEVAREESDYQRQQAEKEKQSADRLRLEADSQRLKARQYLYYSRVSLASRAWNDAQIQRMSELLQSERGQLPGEDLRRFEWHYLWRIRQSLQSSIQGHSDQIECGSWSSDGNYYATGSRDMTIRIWDSSFFDSPVQTLKGHTGVVLDVTFSPDGQLLASASGDQTVMIWDLKSGQTLRTLRGHTSVVRRLSWSTDGKQLASSSWDGTVRLWNTATWQNSLVFKGHTQSVESVSFSPDSKWLASASGDRTVKVWNPVSGAEFFTCTGHKDWITDVAWSRDGKYLATASSDNTIKIWESGGGKELVTLWGHTSIVRKVQFGLHSTQLASASSDGTVRLWDTVTGKERTTLRGHTGRVSTVSFRPDGKKLASASFDKTIRFWDVNTDQDSVVLRGHNFWVWGAKFSPNDQYVASHSLDNSAIIWDVSSGKKQFHLLGHRKGVTCVAFSPDGKLLATSSMDRTVKIWNVATGKVERTLSSHRHPVHFVAFSPTGKSLVSATGCLWYSSEDVRGIPAEVKIWRVADWQEVASLPGFKGQVTGVSYSPKGDRLATTSFDGTLRLWDMSNHRELVTVKWDQSSPSSVAFHPNGEFVATGSFDGTLQIWDTITGQQIKRMHGHSEDILAIAYSPDGLRLASASHDATVKLWEPTIGYEVLSLKVHKNPVLGVAFSHDGFRMVSTSQDYTVRIFDASPLSEPTTRPRNP